MIEFLEHLDRQVVLAINHLAACWLDEVMVTFSQRWIWLPLYLLLAIRVFIRMKKQFVFVLLALALLITLSDQGSVMLKELIGRYRPCHHTELSALLHLPDGCGGLFGFPSSHASNTAALTGFLFLLFGKRMDWMSHLLILWCAIVGFSRMYLGRHYFSDILAGWLFGLFCAILVYFLMNRLLTYVLSQKKAF
jgi:undecaprenyl-diphosphatase